MSTSVSSNAPPLLNLCKTQISYRLSTPNHSRLPGQCQSAICNSTAAASSTSTTAILSSFTQINSPTTPVTHYTRFADWRRGRPHFRWLGGQVFNLQDFPKIIKVSLFIGIFKHWGGDMPPPCLLPDSDVPVIRLLRREVVSRLIEF